MDEQQSEFSWLSGGGEMGKLIRAMDWSSTPLGPLDTWPQSLRTAVSLCLSSTFPILIAWGPHDIQIYNDAYRPICGAKHPESMDQDFRICWATALPVVGDAFDRAHQGEGTYIRDQRMFLDRYGYLEEAFMTFSFSPIRVESGEVGGVFHPISESTDKVLGARRTAALRELATALGKCLSIDDLCQGLEQRHTAMELDLPFMLFYQLEGDVLQRRGMAGIAADSALAPASVRLDDAQVWPFAQALAEQRMVQVDDLAVRFGPFVAGPYEEAPVQAVILPVTVAGMEQPFGFVVAGVSARRALDAEYQDFYALLGGALSTAVSNVLVYLHEQRKAEELAQIDRAKTAFFSNISHEFRTPLTLMVGPLDDALADQAEPLGPAQRKRLEVTHRNSLRLLKLVNALLDFSRIEAGRAKASFVATDLAGLTEDLASVFRSTIEKAGLRYEVQALPLPEAVHVDRDMWEKIVFNLLSNAFKFTFEGSITVRLEPFEGRVRLSVTDTGSGIALDQQARVFERFHRIDNAHGRTYEGTGIGLALIQELVKLHHGQIGVHSVPGAGSTFFVEIPFGTAHLQADDVIRADAVAISQDRQPGQAFVEEAQAWLPAATTALLAGTVADAPPGAAPGAPLPHEGTQAVRIVIADDNRDMREYLQRLLGGYAEVQVCADGEAAWKAVHASPPDLVLSDVMMPVLDGFGLLARIKNDAHTREVPVILLSARAGEEARIEGIAAGADDYLVKPFAATELMIRVKSQVDAARRRKAARQALLASERYFRSLVDASTAIIWTTGPDGRTTYFSRHWHDFTGLPASAIPEGGHIACIHPEDREAAVAEFVRCQQTRSVFHAVYRLRHADGGYRWVIDSGTPLPTGDDLPGGFVGAIVDVHEEREAKRNLELLAQDLTTINRRQREFLVTLAHELRNPLAPIRNGLEVMKLIGAGSERQHNIHQMMDRQIRHLAHLIEDLLDISRITEGKIKLRKQHMSVKSALASAVEISMPLIEKNRHKLELEAPESDLYLQADTHRVVQVVSNILNNAAKYTPAGGLIRVTARMDGEDVLISVSDNGVGLAAEDIGTVFDMFTQIQSEVDRAQGGLGIGLHLVKRLVDLHEGSVSVTSAGPGQGATFMVRLPQKTAAQRSESTGEPSQAEGGRGLEILIVDDNADNADMLAMLLNYRGHATHVAGNGAEALRLMQEVKPDAGFIDIGLPDMSGYALARQLRDHEQGAAMQLIALTGRGSEADRQEAAAAGFDHHLTKPAPLERLVEILAGAGQGR